MQEELMNKNTDLKELFVQQKYEEMIDVLDALTKEEKIELAYFNMDVIKKYYDSEKYDLIKQYLTFVAYCSFIFEYSAKSGLLEDAKVEEWNLLFENIFEIVKR